MRESTDAVGQSGSDRIKVHSVQGRGHHEYDSLGEMMELRFKVRTQSLHSNTATLYTAANATTGEVTGKKR